MAPNAIPFSLGDDEARNTRNQHGFQVLMGKQRRTVGNFFLRMLALPIVKSLVGTRD